MDIRESMKSRTILYDKEISVTLYRPPQITPPTYVVGIVKGYDKAMLPANRILYNVGQGDEPEAVSGANPPASIIEFYPNTVREVFLGYRTTETGERYARFRRVSAKGHRITLDTLEQLKSGNTPSGESYETGCVVRVKEDGSLWNVFVRDGSENSVMDGTIVERTADTLEINCTRDGMKPDMALSINLLPGQNCYGAILKVRNFNLDAIDIRSWTRMVITAGYRTGSHVQYTCPVFTSYVEAPNPDGITTFEGLTVGTADSILNTQEIEIHFKKNDITLTELVESIAPAIAPNLTIECAIDDSIMKQTIAIPTQVVYAQNGMAVLSWLQSTLTSFIETASLNRENGERVSAFIQLTGNSLQIFALNGPNKKPDIVETIVDLSMVTSAVFNGTALTVEAPWNPALQPGGLFYMPPQFINGSKLPNVLPVEDYKNDDNLYRALTISIAFASCENTNKMTVLAIPSQWAGQLPANKSTEMRGDLFARAIASTVQGQMNIFDVPKGGDVAVQKVNNIKDAPETGKKMFDENNILNVWGDWISITLDPDGYNCISLVLRYYFYDKLDGPRLVPGTQGDGDHDDSYNKSRDELKKLGYGDALTYYQNSGCWSNPVWWPLVVVGTYWKKYVDDANNAGNNWSKINILNPNNVEAKKDLYIPRFSGSWKSMESKLKAVKDVWKFAYIEYKALYPEMCKVWRAMYYYLGGTHTDELS